MLVRMRKVSADTIDRAVNKPRSGRWRIGSVLLADKLAERDRSWPRS